MARGRRSVLCDLRTGGVHSRTAVGMDRWNRSHRLGHDELLLFAGLGSAPHLLTQARGPGLLRPRTRHGRVRLPQIARASVDGTNDDRSGASKRGLPARRRKEVRQRLRFPARSRGPTRRSCRVRASSGQFLPPKASPPPSPPRSSWRRTPARPGDAAGARLDRPIDRPRYLQKVVS